MSSRVPVKRRIELLQGTLDFLILSSLKHGPRHGYGISLSIRAASADVLQVETGSLYPALHRLERHGWVSSRWDQTDRNQRAKFYELTRGGKEQLSRERQRWQELVDAIAAVVNAAPQTGEA